MTNTKKYIEMANDVIQDMQTNCFGCNINLVSALEIKAGACLTCFPDMTARLRTLTTDCAKLLVEKRESDELRDRLLSMLPLQNALIVAESCGVKAAENGVVRSSNPYPPCSDESVLWEDGWYHAWFPIELQRMKSVMLWSLDMLSSVRELALEYGKNDISSRIDDVITKVGPYLEDILDNEKEEKLG